MESEQYGIDIDNAHKRAVELIPEAFFWSSDDELAPFGSDEGDTALDEYRGWRKDHPDTPTIRCLQWVVESVGEIDFTDYNRELAQREAVKAAVEDEDYDDQQYIYTLDASVIATGFAQLVNEGVIEPANKAVIQVAIDRQKVWAELSSEWTHSAAYIENLVVLDRVLKAA